MSVSPPASPPEPSNGGNRARAETPSGEAAEPAFDPNAGSRQAYPIPPAKSAPPLDNRLAVKAKKLLQRARTLYGKGEYDKAEVLLKEVVTTYPFMAEANLMLGKIFLIRGSATRDRDKNKT